MVQEKLVLEKTAEYKRFVEEHFPKLRFREFESSWTPMNLGQVGDTKDAVIAGPFGSNLKVKDYQDEGFPLIRLQNIERCKFIDKDIKYVSEKKAKELEHHSFKAGDILFSKLGNPIGKTCRAPEYFKEGIVVADVVRIRPSKDKINYDFLVEVLNSENIKKQIENDTIGSTRTRLNLSQVRNLTFNVPSLNEQNKIADFLISINKKIDLLEDKYKNKKNIQKYYLNKILTDGFEKNKQWDLKPLNEITFYQEGPGVRNYQYVSEGIKLLNVGNFVENKLVLENTDRYISEEEAYGMYNHFLVDEGDLLIACSGIKAEYFDEKIAFAEKEHLPLCMNTSTMRFKSLDEDYLNLNYLKWYFQTTLFKKQIFRVLTGSAQFNFGPTHLKYLKIIVPPLDYQIKISNFFDLLKKDLNYTKDQIDEMKKFKKGLLQKMFV